MVSFLPDIEKPPESHGCVSLEKRTKANRIILNGGICLIIVPHENNQITQTNTVQIRYASINATIQRICQNYVPRIIWPHVSGQGHTNTVAQSLGELTNIMQATYSKSLSWLKYLFYSSNWKKGVCLGACENEPALIKYTGLHQTGGNSLSEVSLQWRHNSVSDHQPHDCLLNLLFGRNSKKTSKLRVIGLCDGNSPVTGEFPAQKGQ